jgi:hypothetical protein
MAHPQNKHHRLFIAIKKGLKRAFAHHGYVKFESLRQPGDPDYIEGKDEDYIQDVRIHRNTTTRRSHTGEHNAFIGEKAMFKARKANESLKNLEYVYEPIKAYDMEYLFV